MIDLDPSDDQLSRYRHEVRVLEHRLHELRLELARAEQRAEVAERAAESARADRDLALRIRDAAACDFEAERDRRWACERELAQRGAA